jgi:hypothetical protein
MTMTAILREGEQPLLGLALEQVERNLSRVEAIRRERTLKLSERARRVLRDADPVDAARVPLGLEPGQMAFPRDEVVHLLDLDPSQDAPLELVLAPTLGDGRRPDLRRDDRLGAASLERGAQ